MKRNNATHYQQDELQAGLQPDCNVQSDGDNSAALLYAHSFRNKTWVRFMGVFLSVLLVITMFDFPTAIATAASLQDRAQQAQEQTDSGIADQSDQDQDEQNSASNNASGGDDNPAAVTDSDQDSENIDQNQQDNAEQNASENNQVITEEQTPDPEQQAQEDKQKALGALLPADLIEPDKILPSVGQDSDTPEQKEINQELAKKLVPQISLYNAAADKEGHFLIKGRTAMLQVELPNANQTLEGGFIGASSNNMESDAFVAQIDAPYLYKTEDGSVATTLSREEWLYYEGDKQGGRVKLSTDSLLEGWSIYTQHQDKYAKVTDKELKEQGVAGSIVLRYDGTDEHPRKLDAEVKLPSFELSLEGDLADDQKIEVGFGYSFASWTSADEQVSPLFGKVVEHNAQALTLLNTKTDARIDYDVKQLGQTREEGKAWSYLLIQAISHDTDITQAVLSAIDTRDWSGHNGLADGVRVFDVTEDPAAVESDENLSVDKLAQAGMTELSVVQTEGEAQVKTDVASAGTAKAYVVAVPYDASSAEQILTSEIAPPPQFASKV